MQKIIESPKRMFIIILLAGILGIIAGECYGQTPNYVKLKSIEPAPGSGYAIGTGTNGSPVYTKSLSITTLTATGVVFTNTVSANLFSAQTGSIGAVNSGTITSGSFIKSGGTSSEFLKADGSSDGTVYGSVSNPISQFTPTTSAAVASIITDETGTGSVVFSTNPQFTSNLGVGVASPTTGLANVHFMKGTGSLKFGEYIAGRGAIWVNQATPSTTNWSMSADASNNTFVNGQSQVFIAINGNILSRFTSTTFNTTQDFEISTAGKKITLKEGTNSISGSATLTTGTVTVSNTNVSATSRIFLTGNGTTNAGALTISKNPGVGFTITSTNPLDTRVVDYFIVTGN